MEEIQLLLDKTALLSVKEVELTVVSIFGCSGTQSISDCTSTAVSVANQIVGKTVFVDRTKNDKGMSVVIIDGLQLHVEKSTKTAYLFLDASVSTESLADACCEGKKGLDSTMFSRQSNTMRSLLLMLLVSHLIIPILPQLALTSGFLSDLVILGQIKRNIYTHLVQFQTACWRHWGVSIPTGYADKKEFENRRDRDRTHGNATGCWGPGKGVPTMVFVSVEVPLGSADETVTKRMQENFQTSTANILRAVHLVSVPTDGNANHPPFVETRSLFTLPSSSYSFIHIIPRTSTLSSGDDDTLFTFGKLASLSSFISSNMLDDEGLASSKSHSRQPVSTAAERENYKSKLLESFVSHWIKAATTVRHLHTKPSFQGTRKSDERQPTPAPLPTALQLVSTLVTLRTTLFCLFSKERDFSKAIVSESPNLKGVLQQIDVVLQKKIRDTLEVKRVFSKSHSNEVMRKCIEVYLQDSPPYYTQQYHLWKFEKVARLFQTLARGPCAAEYATRLERECDLVWKQGRQSCEQVSMTGKACRLKGGHDKGVDTSQSASKSSREDRTTIGKHSSGRSFYHACNCGKNQMLREDPFDVNEANIEFYQKFNCCLGGGRAAINVAKSQGKVDMVMDETEIPKSDCVLLYLGPAAIYRNSVGLDKYEGFTANTNYLLPWTLSTMEEPSSKELKGTAEPKKTVMDRNEWPILGKNPTAPRATTSAVKSPPTVSHDAFPALGSTRAPEMLAPVSNTMDVISSKSNEEPKKEKRRRDSRRAREREHRLEGQVRGYIGAEYECPLGHRFLSCGDGTACKLGHKNHPKEHGNYFVLQDVPLFAQCQCTFANNPQKTNVDITAQLQRIYIVTADAPVSVLLKPVVKIKVPLSDNTVDLNLGFDEPLALPSNGVYVLRLPYIYRDNQGKPIPVEPDVEKRLKYAVLERKSFQALQPPSSGGDKQH